MQREDYTRINWGNSFLLHDEQEQSTDIERLKRNCMERSVSRRDPYWSHCFKSTKNKTLNELPKTQQASPKILRDEHIRSFWEAVMIQTILRSNFYNLIFIDDLFFFIFFIKLSTKRIFFGFILSLTSFTNLFKKYAALLLLTIKLATIIFTFLNHYTFDFSNSALLIWIKSSSF